jgi:hypothetical protein
MAPKPAPPPLVVAGPPTAMTVEDRLWADQAEKLELEALTAIRGLAEKWAASLTSALGVVGLAALFQSAGKFDKLDDPWKAIAQICFTLAVLLALVASGLSIAAAQGAAKRVFVPGGAALREYSKSAVHDALRDLKVSRILAALAAVAVLGTAYCLWFGNRAESSATVIELPAGSQTCAGAGKTDVTTSDADFVVRCGK